MKMKTRGPSLCDVELTHDSRYHKHAHCAVEEEVNNNNTAAATMSDLPVAFASLINCQKLILDLYRILTKHIDRQRRRVNYLLQTRRRRRRERSLWTRPGRTSQYWDNFVDGKTDALAWVEDFRMSKESLVYLSEQLRPYIEGETTRMRAPVDVLKKVALTLYYLNDGSRRSIIYLRKKAHNMQTMDFYDTKACQIERGKIKRPLQLQCW